jgi:RNA polymerase sigma factor (sigma-70 family)
MMGKSGGKFENLAVAVHRKSDGALEYLVRTYQDRLFNYALRLIANSSDAQEITQDTFLRAHRALTARYDEARCAGLLLGPWLYRITRNLAHSRRHRRAARKEMPIEGAGDRNAPMLRCPPEAARNIEASERTRTLDLALDHLGPEGRELIVLRFMEEMSYAEIAAIVGTGEASVRGKVFRALGKLRSTLEKMTGGKDAL